MAQLSSCPDCGSDVDPFDEFCPMCRYPLPPTTPARVTPPGSTRTCLNPTCGQSNPGDEATCAYCGEPLTSAAGSPGAQAPVPGLRLVTPWGDFSLVEDGETVVGRGEGPWVRELAGDEFGTVSRRHAGLELRSGRLMVTDYGSTNGTWIDGKRLPQHRPTPLTPGSSIRFSSALEVRFETGLDS